MIKDNEKEIISEVIKKEDLIEIYEQVEEFVDFLKVQINNYEEKEN